MSISENWVEFEGQRYRVKPGERALDAMLRQGAPVNFSCRKGTCRSCMLQAVSGEVGEAATERLPQDYRDQGFFLPCCATDVNAVVATRPDLSLCTNEAMVAGKRYAAPDIVVLQLECAKAIEWTAGQVIGLMNDKGAVRSYSLVTSTTDYLVEVHIRIYADGEVSGWVDTLSEGDLVQFQGPSGDFVYREEMSDRPLLLVGTGTGSGAVVGIARDALARGHAGPVHLYLGGRTADDLYLRDSLTDLAGRVTLVQAASRQDVGDQPAARVTDLAFQAHPDVSGYDIFICGNPAMCESARVQAMRSGAALAKLHTDVFDPPTPYQTNEREKLESLQPNAEIWAALGHGDGLTEILTEFYTQVFDDPRLAPFFRRTTKQRAIEKQYNFLQDVFAGTKLFFGEKPFNAHHWMVISDELFDYRENMFFDVVRRHGIAEPIIRQWAALHEMFRRDIVKQAPRGILHRGVEVDLEGYSHETIDIGSVCDGCMNEVAAGETVLMHKRTGEIFCVTCERGQEMQVA